MNVTYLCLGGNIGDRETALNQAIFIISQEIGNIVSKSGIYETEAWGVENQQAYLNQCVAVTTNLTAEELIHKVLVIEKKLGRERSNSIIYEPRIIDIDIIFYNNTIIETPQLTVPHPRLHLRKFVLIPLSEIASNHLHPILNKTIFNLLSDCEDQSEVKEFKQK